MEFKYNSDDSIKAWHEDDRIIDQDKLRTAPVNDVNRELVKKIKAARSAHEDDSGLLMELYNNNRGLMLRTIRRYGIDCQLYDDAMQECFIGLLDAVNAYDPEQDKAKFSTFFVYGILNACRECAYKSGGIRIPKNIRLAAVHYKRYVTGYQTAHTGRTPDDASIMDELQISSEELANVRACIKVMDIRSLSCPVNDDESLTLEDTIAARAADTDIENEYITGSLYRGLWQAVDDLQEGPILRDVFQDRKTMKQICGEHELTTDQARRMKNTGLQKLKHDRRITVFADDYYRHAPRGYNSVTEYLAIKHSEKSLTV